jgi:predicted nucleotidyltransferase component of viral defense system
MTKSNLAASIRQRLKNHAKESGESFNLILVRFGLERLLYRITETQPKDLFVLKGGALFYCWTEKLHRPTRDIDLLGTGEPSRERFQKIFTEVISAEYEDGLVFDKDSLVVDRVKDDQQYSGLRVSCVAYLDNAKINLQIDIGFGDATVPDPEMVEYPVLLDLPAPSIRAYKKETVIAEKLQAMVDLGIANSRMKDFFDLYALALSFEFDGIELSEAIKATFERRETKIPAELPMALTSEFSRNDDKQKQWTAFAKKLELSTTLEETVQTIADFIMPCLVALSTSDPFAKKWIEEQWREA